MGNGKTMLVEKESYSKQDLIKVRRLGREIKEAKKDPKFVKALNEFIKATT